MGSYDVLVVGAGLFGVTAALELSEREYRVAVLDTGPLPRPEASSTDISKVVRMEYGADEEYMALVEDAREGWLRWNADFGATLYHEVGVTMLTSSSMSPGSFEYESYQLLISRGHSPERLNSQAIAERFPAWNAEHYTDGFFNPEGGYVEASRVIKALIQRASEEGTVFHIGETVNKLVENGDRVVGISTTDGRVYHAEHVVIAVGAWTPFLVPEVSDVMRAVGQPVFHLRPDRKSLFEPSNFSVFTADITETGWYGFPVHPREGVVKIANHGVGEPLHPSGDERVVTAADLKRLRTFLTRTFSLLVDAVLVRTHRCLYCDTLDEHLWIARDPDREGLTVAAGGSGHGFKFGPVLGELIADAVEGEFNPYLRKFRWRTLAPDTTGEEAARYHGERAGS